MFGLKSKNKDVYKDFDLRKNLQPAFDKQEIWNYLERKYADKAKQLQHKVTADDKVSEKDMTRYNNFVYKVCADIVLTFGNEGIDFLCYNHLYEGLDIMIGNIYNNE